MINKILPIACALLVFAVTAEAGPFKLGGWYNITLTSGKQRHVIVREVNQDAIRVSSCDERLAGQEYWEWIFIKNIESFSRFALDKGEPE
jgi:hypothetical protein